MYVEARVNKDVTESLRFYLASDEFDLLLVFTATASWRRGVFHPPSQFDKLVRPVLNFLTLRLSYYRAPSCSIFICPIWISASPAQFLSSAGFLAKEQCFRGGKGEETLET